MAGGGSMASSDVATGPMVGESAVNRAAEAVGAPPIASDRLRYLRKVYALLGTAAFLAVFSGWAATSLGPTVEFIYVPRNAIVHVPFLTALFLQSEIAMLAAFGVLFVATIGASWVSKVPILNVAALMGVAVLMGVQLAPMVYAAQVFADFGDSLSANPVRDAMIMVMCVFVGITGYVFVTRKDFSWMGSILSMGFFVVFGACILTFFLDSEPFALAVACVGALLAIGMLLYVTSYIFRNSKMDDAVGDALALLVQLRNLFMFLLRIFMSRR
jgi:modulator of FtsH protease